MPHRTLAEIRESIRRTDTLIAELERYRERLRGVIAELRRRAELLDSMKKWEPGRN